MKYSQSLIRTAKETPADETAKNAKLLIRGCYIYKTMAGVYNFLPLGLKVLNNISNIVREEMNAIGCNELLMSSMVSKEAWQTTGRWDTVDVLYKMDRADGKEVALSPTHEEIVTPLVQNYLASHKDFPLCVYQIQNKFRNEARAKSGLLRGREFLMKDAYSFHLTEECFEKFYAQMTEAYHKVYARLGIGDITKYTYASGGDFSEFSHEFQTLSEIGEDDLFYTPSEKKFRNKEIVASKARPFDNADEEVQPMEHVLGKGLIGVEALAKFFDIAVEKTTKTIIFETESGKVIAAAIRGDYNVDENKLKKIVGENFSLASAETVKRVTGAEVGYAGVLELPEDVEVLFDESCDNRTNWETGNNKTDYHTINVNWGRDVEKPEKFHDFKVPQVGDMNPETGEVYEVTKAVEVGNIFPLADKFTKPFKFSVQDENGKKVNPIMGCYGIGVSRVMGVLAELFADDKGLVWPENVAPFQVYLAAVGKSDEMIAQAEKIYAELKAKGVEVLYDDRQGKKFGFGTKLADYELLGIPKCIIVSDKLLKDGNAEIRTRKTGKTEIVKIENCVETFC
jgi:prolyl-tRNA synthetase